MMSISSITALLLYSWCIWSVGALPVPICDFIAATNVESLYSQWACYPNGTTTSNPCMDPVWWGITCNGNSTSSEIIQLFIDSVPLVGTLPSGMGSMTSLQTMKLYANSLYGSIPSSFGSLSELQVLNLLRNGLGGSVPATFGSLTALNELQCANNMLTGPLPPSIGSMIGLQNIDLSYNFLSSSIPLSIGSLAQLTLIHLNTNCLSGSLPVSIGSLAELEQLDFSSNCLSGFIPVTVGSMTSLEFLIIGDNKLFGTLPSALGTLIGLSDLDFNDNLLTGSLHSNLGSLTRLNQLNLNNNQISGSIPASFGNLTELMNLHLDFNNITGTVPYSLGFLNNTQLFVYLNNNQLSGALPSSLGFMTGLQLLDLYSNQITGTIPSSLGGCINVRYIRMQNNFIAGSFPSSFETLVKLNYLFLFNNQMTGTLPPQVGSMSRLEYMDLYDNSITGTIPTSMGNASWLQYVYLDGNSLTGTIPSNLGLSLQFLSFLQLSRNHLTGQLGGMEFHSGLQFLFLDNNAFSGVLPVSLGQVRELSYLDLHNNKFSGPVRLLDIPPLVYIDLSNNLFNGSLPSNLSEHVGTVYVNDNALTGYIPMEFGLSSSLHSLNISGSFIGGAIPLEFCASNGTNIDVSGTHIQCYEGCLTSAAILVTGATADCHDGSIMRYFIIACAVVFSLILIFSFLFRRSSWGMPAASDGVIYSNNSVSRIPEWLKHLWTHYTPSVVLIGLLKLLLVIVVSITLNQWWSYSSNKSTSANNVVLESCSNPTVGDCYSYCGDVITVDVNITDDDYAIDGDHSPPQIYTYAHYALSSYCIAELRGYCAYDYWLLFKLVPIMLHVVGFVLQCIALWYHQEFTPQQRQYDIIISHRYPSLLANSCNSNRNSICNRNKDTNGGDCESSVGNETVVHGELQSDTMLNELTKRPSDSIFVFLEMVTVVYVWGELLYPPVYCGSVRPLSLYYYPIVMSLLDLTKFNIYVCTELFRRKQYLLAIFSVLDLEIFVSNFWISTCLSGIFMYNMWLKMCACCVISGASEEVVVTDTAPTMNPMDRNNDLDGGGNFNNHATGIVKRNNDDCGGVVTLPTALVELEPRVSDSCTFSNHTENSCQS